MKVAKEQTSKPDEPVKEEDKGRKNGGDKGGD